MAADLLQLAGDYLAARRAYQDALAATNAASLALGTAEAQLIDGWNNFEGEDLGTAMVYGATCLELREEYWDLPAGTRFHVHRLFLVSP